MTEESVDLAAIIGDRIEFPAEVYLDGPDRPPCSVKVKIDPTSSRLSSDPRWGMAGPEYDSYVDARTPQLMQLCGEFGLSVAAGYVRIGHKVPMAVGEAFIDVWLEIVKPTGTGSSVDFESVGCPRATLVRQKSWRDGPPERPDLT